MRRGDAAPDNEALDALDRRSAEERAGLLHGDDLCAWRALPAWSATRAVCHALMTWLASLLGRPPACASTPAWASDAWGPTTAGWTTHPWVQALLVDVARTLEWDAATREQLTTLMRLRMTIIQWLRPEASRGRSGRHALLDFMLHLTGWMWALLLTRWQARQGRHRHGAARRRLVGFPAQLADAIARQD